MAFRDGGQGGKLERENGCGDLSVEIAKDRGSGKRSGIAQTAGDHNGFLTIP